METPINLAIEFVRGPSGSTGSQTGDFISLIFIFVLSLIIVITLCCLVFSSNQKLLFNFCSRKHMTCYSMFQKFFNKPIKTRIFLFVVFGFFAACLIASCVGALVSKQAFAVNNQPLKINPEKITAEIREDGSIVFEESIITNVNNDRYILKSTNVTVSQEAQNVSAIHTANLAINAFEGTVYSGLPNGSDYNVNNVKALSKNESTVLTFDVSNLDIDSALALCGKLVYEITFIPAKVATQIEIDELNELLKKAEELDPTIYNEESWIRLQSALEFGRKAKSEEPPKEEYITEATKAIDDAINQLSTEASKQEVVVLNELLKTAEGLDPNLYTSDAWKTLQEVEAKAAATLAQDPPQHKPVVEVTLELEAAIYATGASEQEIIDLQAQIADAKTINEEQCTAEVWVSLKDAEKNANNVLAQDSPQHKDVVDAITALDNAISLAKASEQEINTLNNEISEGNKARLGDWSKASVRKLLTEINKANQALAVDTPMHKAVVSATTNINSAIKSLVYAKLATIHLSNGMQDIDKSKKYQYAPIFENGNNLPGVMFYDDSYNEITNMSYKIAYAKVEIGCSFNYIWDFEDATWNNLYKFSSGTEPTDYNKTPADTLVDDYKDKFGLIAKEDIPLDLIVEDFAKGTHPLYFDFGIDDLWDIYGRFKREDWCLGNSNDRSSFVTRYASDKDHVWSWAANKGREFIRDYDLRNGTGSSIVVKGTYTAHDTTSDEIAALDNTIKSVQKPWLKGDYTKSSIRKLQSEVAKGQAILEEKDKEAWDVLRATASIKKAYNQLKPTTLEKVDLVPGEKTARLCPLFTSDINGVMFFDSDYNEITQMSQSIKYAWVEAGYSFNYVRTVRADWNDVYAFSNESEVTDYNSTPADQHADNYKTTLGLSDAEEVPFYIKDGDKPPLCNGVSIDELACIYGKNREGLFGGFNKPGCLTAYAVSTTNAWIRSFDKGFISGYEVWNNDCNRLNSGDYGPCALIVGTHTYEK